MNSMDALKEELEYELANLEPEEVERIRKETTEKTLKIIMEYHEAIDELFDNAPEEGKAIFAAAYFEAMAQFAYGAGVSSNTTANVFQSILADMEENRQDE